MAQRDFAAEHEAALAENEAQRTAIRKQYSIREAVRRASEIVDVVDETLGTVRFGVLSIKEFEALDLAKYKSKEEMLRVVIFAMFRKADPEISLENIEAMPMDDYTIVTSIVTRYLPGFLRLGTQILKAGSTSTQAPKT